MTVNINTNTPKVQSSKSTTVQHKAEISPAVASKSAREGLNRLSSGITLPEKKAADDSTSISAEAVENSTTPDIAAMQEEANQIEAFQGILEDVSKDIWEIEEQVTTTQRMEKEENDSTENTAQEMAEKQQEAMKEEAQTIVDTRLDSINEKGGELLNFIQGFQENFAENIQEINSRFLGLVEEDRQDFSLESLRDSVRLDSPTAEKITSRAQEDIASIQVSTETHRNNILNEINDVLGNAINNLENTDPAARNSNNIDNSIAQISSILLNNPAAFAGATGIDSSKASSLLL